MIVMMVQVGIVRMAMNQGCMAMAVRMRFVLKDTRIVEMLVMFIMSVAVLVLDDAVRVFMAVRFAQVKIDTDGHQRARDHDAKGQGSRKSRQRQYRTNEGCGGEVSRGARGTEMAQRSNEQGQADSIAEKAHQSRQGQHGGSGKFGSAAQRQCDVDTAGDQAFDHGNLQRIRA